MAKKKKRKTLSTRQLRTNLQGLIPCPDMYAQGYAKNYGAHCMRFDFMDIAFWFSYTTLIAFQFPGKSIVKMKNYWGPTTAYHMSNIHGNRLPYWSVGVGEEEFYVRYANGLKEMGLYKGPKVCLHTDPETRELTGDIALCRPHEEPIPPQASEFYLHPVYKTPKEVKEWHQAIEDKRLARNARARERRRERKEEAIAAAKAEALRHEMLPSLIEPVPEAMYD